MQLLIQWRLIVQPSRLRKAEGLLKLIVKLHEPHPHNIGYVLIPASEIKEIANFLVDSLIEEKHHCPDITQAFEAGYAAGQEDGETPKWIKRKGVILSYAEWTAELKGMEISFEEWLAKSEAS